LRRIFVLLFFAVFGAASAQIAQPQTPQPWHAAPGHETIPLWPHGAPGNPPHSKAESYTSPQGLVAGRPITVVSDVSDPTITVYLPQEHPNGAAVVIFPGGGYRILAIDLEGTEVAQWLNSIGVAAFLVKYRVPNSGPYPEHGAALQDAQRAMGIVRSRAAEWKIDPHRIGVIGFSAGANLAVALSNRYATRIYSPVDAADQTNCRPDFSLVIYPWDLVIANGGFALDPDVTIDPNGPPTFLIQAEDDPVHVQNAILYYLALRKANIPAEMHIYSHGGHGYGLRPTGLPITHWPKLASVWLHTIGIVP
jgi:acetyl esterase/lipase